jgi:hypothetical protein
MKRIVYTRPDGGVSIVVPCISQDDPPDFTEEQAVARATAKNVPANATHVQVMEEGDIPSDRTFRGAWVRSGDVISCDMTRARAIHRARMRDARRPKFASLDAEYLRADEAGDVLRKQQVAAQKQELRDVTAAPAIESAVTPDALKAVWPECLK